MKTPLIVKGSKLLAQPAAVFLLAGTWTILTNHKEGTIFLDSEDGPVPVIHEMKVPGDRAYRVRFDSCTESDITISAEKV